MTTIHAEQLSDAEPGTIRTGLARLLGSSRVSFDPEPRVLVVPDVHYPFHPSTGLVTNPDVVAELVGLLDRDVAIGIPASEYIDADRAGQYLGYDQVAERTGTDLVHLDAVDRIERRVRFADGSMSLAIPAPLLDDAVVVVPTARRSRRLGVAAGTVTLARAVAEEPTREEILATLRTCEPALSVLDATFVYAGAPRWEDTLLASDDVVALSRAAADMLDVDRADLPHLFPRRTPPSPLEVLSNIRPSGRPSEGDGAMVKGYQLYARLTGDLAPPQMLSRSDPE